MLEVLAVDRVDDAVGANELDSTVDVDVYHRATLTVLGREKISRKAAMAHPTQTVPRAPPPQPGRSGSRQAEDSGWDGDERLTVERMWRTTSRGTTERSSSFSCRENETGMKAADLQAECTLPKVKLIRQKQTSQ